MDLEEFSDDDDREARLYAMLHFVDSETTDKYFSPGEIISENDNPSSNNANLDENRMVATIVNNENKIIKDNSSFESIKKKVSHAGRYWASANTEVLPIVEVNSQYQKININAGVKVAPLGKTPDIAPEKNLESIVTLGDKWATKRKTSESTSPKPNNDLIDSHVKLISSLPRRSDSKRSSTDEACVEKQSPKIVIIEDLDKDTTKIQLSNESNISSNTKKKKSSVPELDKSINETTPIQLPNVQSDISSLVMKKKVSSKSQTVESSRSSVIQVQNKKTNKSKIQLSSAEDNNEGKKKKGSDQNVSRNIKRNSASTQLSNAESEICPLAKKKKSPKSKSSCTRTTNKVKSIAHDGVITLVSKTRSKNPTSARATLVEKIAAEKSLKRKLTKSLKNPFAKIFHVNPSIITLDSSDDDSVVEVKLPPTHHTTIYLDSSDESPSEDTSITNKNNTLTMSSATQTETTDSSRNKVTAVSPVPSVMSSVSDDFIQGDCSSLNISSHLTFNFGLHGIDLCEVPIDNTPSKSSKKSKKNSATYTEEIIQKTTSALTTLSNNSDNIQPSTDSSKNMLETSPNESECFATPKNKIERRRNSKPKTYDVPDQSYVTPSIDVYESESSDFPDSVIDVPIKSVPKKKKKSFSENFSKNTVDSTIDITDSCRPPEHCVDSLVMANVVGLPTDRDYIVIDEVSEDLYGSSPEMNVVSSAVSKKKVSKNSKRKKNKLEKCIRKMHKYYNANWGTDFDHIKLKQEMPKEREFWPIDASDKGRPRKRPIVCGYCNKAGHRSDNCYRKPKVCTMCGATGHKDLRCPNKICLNCGSDNVTSFSSVCDNCRNWRNTFCGICREYGHPSLVCPDTWRRYHLTVTNEVPLIEDKRRKPSSSLFCSGCAKRGHLINNCRSYIAFSDFKSPSPYIFHYTPIYTPDGVRTPLKEPQTTTMRVISEDNGLIKVSVPQSPGKKKAIVIPKLWSPKISKQIFSADTMENVKANLLKHDFKPACVIVREENIVEDLLEKDVILQKQDADSARKIMDTQKNGADLVNKDPDIKKNISDLQKKDEDLQLACSELKKKDINVQRKDSDLLKKDTDLQKKDVDLHKKNIDLNVVSLQQNVEIPTKDVNVIANSLNPTSCNNCDKNDTSSRLLLTKDHAVRLASTQGEEFLKFLSNKYNIATERCFTEIMGTSLVLKGNVEKHTDFQSELQNWMIVHIPPPAHLPGSSIPKLRSAAVAKLSKDIESLKGDLGDPFTIHESLKRLEIKKNEFKTKIITSKSVIRCSKYYVKICKEITKHCRLLNMILIGQEGLGENNCEKLKVFLNLLLTQSSKRLSVKIRDKMGECYNSIFSGAPRDDYPLLIDQYFAIRGTNFRPTTPIIHKSSPSARQATLLTRIRAIMVRLRKATCNGPKNDKNLHDTFTFLNTCEQRVMHETLSNSAFQEMRRGIGVTDKYIFSLRNKHVFM